MSEHPTQAEEKTRRGASVSRARVTLTCVFVFLCALGVRALHWQDNRHYFLPFAGMSGEYKAHAMVLVRGDLRGFVRGPDPPSDANVVKHPPGYPLLMAAVYALFGERDSVLRFLHIALDSFAAALVVLIALELLPLGAAFLAGMLVALSPQLAYHSIALVPDPLAAPPILLALLLILRARRTQRLAHVVAAGALVGLSCWLRSNALLLPFFMAALAPLLFPRGRRLGFASAIVGASLAVIVPVTIRNAVAFRSFIPLSLSAGITLVEGIGVYDKEGRFGLPSTDYGVTKWEAERYGRPDYLGTRFSPDGVARERGRIRAGLDVIRQDPVWFLGVMAHRAASMPRLARVETIASAPATTRPLEVAEGATPAHLIQPSQLAPTDAARARLQLSAPAEADARLDFAGDASGALLVSTPLAVERDTDYLLRLPLRIERGSLVVEITDERDGSIISSTPVQHPINYLDYTAETQPFVTVERPFVSGDAAEVRVAIRNGSSKPASVAASARAAAVYALGPSSFSWTRPLRALLRPVQKLFLTAVMLPLVLLGIALFARARRWDALAVLLVVPAYYMCVQSALWTEFRYVMAMHYLLFILAAAGLHWACVKLFGLARGFRQRRS
ncbi:MAG TPA: glycosyltransferase family 39 protein [Pyrinomonadaceae bacterium]|nr:glycosyltransferase family 39 protein [Pyrinomonadaceae bacterium]